MQQHGNTQWDIETCVTLLSKGSDRSAAAVVLSLSFPAVAAILLPRTSQKTTGRITCLFLAKTSHQVRVYYFIHTPLLLRHCHLVKRLFLETLKEIVKKENLHLAPVSPISL